MTEKISKNFKKINDFKVETVIVLKVTITFTEVVITFNYFLHSGLQNIV